MNYEQYQARVLARCSHRWHSEKLDVEDLDTVLQQFIYWGNALDRVKKSLMYGRDFVEVEGERVLPPEEAAPVPPEREQLLIHAMLGVATEGVEMMETVHDYFFHGTEFDITNLQEEFGDAEWYRALFLATAGQTDEENRTQNDAKLQARFGDVFTEEAANNRNLEQERQVLSGGKAGGPGFEDLA